MVAKVTSTGRGVEVGLGLGVRVAVSVGSGLGVLVGRGVELARRALIFGLAYRNPSRHNPTRPITRAATRTARAPERFFCAGRRGAAAAGLAGGLAGFS